MKNLHFKELLRKFCLESSILGLKYFYIYPNPISRCFWALSMVSTMMFAIILALLLYDRFLEMPTRITIENQYEPIESMPFPAITICSPVQITSKNTEHLKKTLVNGNLSLPFDIILIKLLSFYDTRDEVEKQEMQLFQELIQANRYDILDVMTLLPQTCDSFLVLCYFELRRYDCGQLFAPVVTAYGLCCVFNSVYYYKENKKNERNNSFTPRMAKGSGFRNGLTVVTNYDYEDALDDSILQAGGTLIFFNDWNEFPTEDESSLVPVGVESFHQIEATYTYCSEDVRRLPDWSRGCHFITEIPEWYPWHFSEYHSTDCELLCVMLAVRARCGCVLFHVPYVRITDACNGYHLPCIVDYWLNLHKWSRTRCECPRDCESRRYDVAANNGNFDAIPHMTYDLYSDVEIKECTTILHFFFPTTVYMKQKHETMISMISLESNLGGVFGLCLGCSVMSVLEILFYTYIGIRGYIQRKLSARRVTFAN